MFWQGLFTGIIVGMALLIGIAYLVSKYIENMDDE
jgi:hypothetical protein